MALSSDREIVEMFARQLMTDEPDELGGEHDHRRNGNGTSRTRQATKE
jgi:hypothetical protein